MSKQVDANGVLLLEAPTSQQINDALDPAAVGDDHIQAQSGSVNPESWTHGSSETRTVRWFDVCRRPGCVRHVLGFRRSIMQEARPARSGSLSTIEPYEREC